MMKRFTLSLSEAYPDILCFDDFVGDFDTEQEAIQWCVDNYTQISEDVEYIRLIDLEQKQKRTAFCIRRNYVPNGFIWEWGTDWQDLKEKTKFDHDASRRLNEVHYECVKNRRF